MNSNLFLTNWLCLSRFLIYLRQKKCTDYRPFKKKIVFEKEVVITEG